MTTVIQTLLTETIARASSQTPDRTPLIGVGGAQGSGKSYQCRKYAETHPCVAHLSLDDVYFTKAERAELARRFHPLFATRGPPGTHALGLAKQTIAALRAAPLPVEGERGRGWGDVVQTPASVGNGTPTPAPPPSRGREQVALPRFNKAADDRAPESTWPRFRGRPGAILFDGWCVGASALDFDPAPINALERDDDPDGRWRAQLNKDLAERYQRFFDAFDAFIYLRAPSWEIVRRWRGEQEEETLGRPLTAEDETRLDRFCMHYERITRAMLNGHHRARWIVHLDERRSVVRVEERI